MWQLTITNPLSNTWIFFWMKPTISGGGSRFPSKRRPRQTILPTFQKKSHRKLRNLGRGGGGCGGRGVLECKTFQWYSQIMGYWWVQEVSDPKLRGRVSICETPLWRNMGPGRHPQEGDRDRPQLPTVDRQKSVQNITLPQTLFAGGKNLSDALLP